MDPMLLADRRKLRRKVTFWRVAAALLVAIIGFGIFSYASEEKGLARPHIARINLDGIIQDDPELLERLKKIEESDSAKGLIVSISSPGGTTYGGERIFKAIRAVAAKKPVVSDVRTLAASAGYMVAVAGDTIFAGESSITGSIGVIFQYPQAKPLLDKVGVSLEEIKSAPMKAEPSPFHAPPEEAKTMIRTVVMDSFDWFVDLVAERRKLPRAEVLRLADGRILTGRQALKEKLVDKLGGEDEILAYFKGRGLDETLKIEEWKRDEDNGYFGMNALLRTALGLAGMDAGRGPADFVDFLRGKLFLDGLVSVWQVD